MSSISGISGVSGASGVSAVSAYNNIASGKKINSAADNASGLAISEKLESQINGYNQATDNALAGKDVINIADNSLSNIQDGLQRIYELSIKASNGIYSADDLSMIQDEISQIKAGIQDTAKGTQFNKINLLDGSKADLQLATNPSGGGLKIQLYNSTLEALGIDDYDVTKNFDISAIQKAIDTVSSARSSMGAQSNALDSIVSNNSYTSLNTSSAKSRIEDADIYEEVTKKKQSEILEQYRIFAQKAQLDQKKSFNRVLGING